MKYRDYILEPEGKRNIIAYISQKEAWSVRSVFTKFKDIASGSYSVNVALVFFLAIILILFTYVTIYYWFINDVGVQKSPIKENQT